RSFPRPRPTARWLLRALSEAGRRRAAPGAGACAAGYSVGTRGGFRFEPRGPPPGGRALRGQGGAVLRETPGGRPPGRRARSWGGFDPEFSRKLGARGWIGLTWPKRYGGQERSFLERYVLLEELLAAGAPAGAHWVAERQSGPLLLRFGTEAQRERFLPPI